ncbi:hypothetical protein CW362_05175 [Streptomyces populi]|uniref:DNA-binding protein n=1 Tax=Streptomyces populi TaxID=2058924 RepID=A0A2I0SVT2_9ACTN|nr:hypothetical protein [Streptomyces populi]PKT74047.1 hypothetical protein CW362_05175 [Streptomyces populi]
MADPQSNAALPAYPLPELHSQPAPPELPPDAPRAGVLHVRHRHAERYTVVGNHLAQHPRLSAVAIGVGVHIQSLPDGASVTVKALTLRFPEGEVTMGRALRELEAAGYLVRCRVPLGGGRIATRTFFLDCPVTAVRSAARGKGSAGGSGGSGGSGDGGGGGGDAEMAGPVPPVAEVDPEPRSAPRPLAAPKPTEGSRPDSPAAPVRTRRVTPDPVPTPTGPAADLLARLRIADPRLLLSERDVRRLAPAVEAWLARAATPDQVTRTLTAGLPPEADPVRHPARFVEYRLTTFLPPPLPAALPPAVSVPTSPRPLPLATCDGCERAFRTHDPNALCRECRDARAAAAHPAA